jgi:drug/metabolite transporter (DMT)-like permease
LFSNTRYIGLFLALSSAVGFLVSNTLAGVAYQGGTNPLTIATTRFILPAIALIVFLRMSGVTLALPKRAGLVTLALGFMTVIYTMALLTAIEILPLAIAILIFYLFPIFTGLMLAMLGWRKLTLTMALSTFIAFVGIGLALGVDFENLDSWGIIYGLISGLGLATVSVVSNRLMVNQDARTATLYICVSTTLMMIVVSIVTGEFTLPTTNSGWISILTSQAFYAYSMIAYYIAISMIGAGDTTFYSNIEPVMAVGTGFLFLGQSLAPLQIVGICVVVFALLYAGRKKSS